MFVNGYNIKIKNQPRGGIGIKLSVTRPQDIRLNNLRLILSIVREQPVTISEIASHTGISRPAAQDALRALQVDGLVVNAGRRVAGETKLGRVPDVWEFNPRGRFTVGVILTSEGVEFALMDLNGEIVERAFQVVTTDYVPRQFIHHLASLLDRWQKEEHYNVLGVALGISGQVSADGAVRYILRLPRWNSFPLQDTLQHELGIAVWVDGWVRFQCLAEMLYGGHADIRNVVCLETGVGVGGSIVMDGQLYRGSSFSAGALGHVQINAEGAVCKCGSRGCLETYVGTEAVINLGRREAQLAGEVFSGTMSELLQAVGDRKPWADAVARETGFWLGIGLASIINMLNPALVVIHGDLVDFGEQLLSQAQTTVQERALHIPGYSPHIVFSHIGRTSGIRGAAALVMQETLGIVPRVIQGP